MFERLLGVLFIAFFCSVGGYLYGQRTANEAHEAQQSKAIAAAEQTLRHRFEQQLDSANKSVIALRQQKAALNKTASELNKRVAHASRSDCVISPEFVGVYNRAIGADLSAADSATGADGAATATHTASAKQSTPVGAVNQQDLLRHAVNYGGQCQAIAAQLNQLIDYLEAQP